MGLIGVTVSKLCSKQYLKVELKMPDQTSSVKGPDLSGKPARLDLFGKHRTVHCSSAKN
jgi:hypothetical protein